VNVATHLTEMRDLADRIVGMGNTLATYDSDRPETNVKVWDLGRELAELVQHLDVTSDIQAAIDSARREQIAAIVEDQLAREIRDKKAAEGKRSDPWPSLTECAVEAAEIIAAMSMPDLEAKYAEVEGDFWELAKSEDHEWYDEASGEISGLEQALKILRGEE